MVSYITTKNKCETYYGCEKWHMISAHKKPIESKEENTFQRPKIVEKIHRCIKSSMLADFTS
jgi:hypothetical protein